MILGLSLPAFTLLHVIISLIAIGSGIAVLVAMASDDRSEGWTALFLLATALTSITGFLFPFNGFGPPDAFGVITLVVLVPVLLGRYYYRLRGWWRLIYIWGAVLMLWLNCVVAVIQFFQKAAPLRALAPSQTEPPFLIAQGIVLGALLVLGLLAAFRFQRSAATAMA